MPLTSTYRNNLVAAAFGTGHAEVFPATYYLGLSTTNPASTATEPSSNGYARVAITNATSDDGSTNAFTTPANGQASNNALITFSAATGAWGNCGYFVLYSAPTGGVLIGYGTLTTPVNVTTDTVVQFPARSLTVTIT
jgi:hypothetical protein